MKFRLVPVEKDAGIHGARGDTQRTDDARARLKSGDITHVLEAHFNRKPSDMADARIDWDSPYVPPAKVVIPQQDITAEKAQKDRIHQRHLLQPVEPVG